jgi:hypothetical protein
MVRTPCNGAVTLDRHCEAMDEGGLEILVVRAWAEPAAGEPRLRVRMVRVSPGQADRPVLTTSSMNDACAAVRDWLMGIERQAAERCS